MTEGFSAGPVIFSGTGLALRLRALRMSRLSESIWVLKSMLPLLLISKVSDTSSVLSWRLMPPLMSLLMEKRLNGVCTSVL